jgi:membrane protein CcdC involved in cytochrome C biogenesis
MLGITRTKIAFVALILSTSTQTLPISALFLIVALSSLIPWKKLFSLLRALRKKS